MGSSAKVERPDREAGFRRPVGRACGSFRLQKSTSGAWHRAPGREERPEAALSSPTSSGSAGRRSVGSRVGAAKSRDRWRARVRDRLAQAGLVERALVDGRRPGSLEPPALTSPRGRWSWRCVLRFGACASRQGRQRSPRSARPRRKTPRSGGATCGLDSIESPAGSGGIRARRIGGGVQRAGRSSGCVVKRASTRVVRWGSSPSDVVSRAQARRPPRESDGPSGARVGRSVAEVGEEHLPRSVRGAARRSGSAG